MSSDKVLKNKECKFVIHKKAVYDDNGEEIVPDLHFIKEKINYEDGTSESHLRILKNFKRPYWLTAPNRRNYEQKKEAELMENLIKFEATESELKNDIIRKLYNVGKPTYKEYKKMKYSPYIYGIDVNSRTFIKKLYEDKYPEAFTSYELATFDIETDIDTGEVILISVARQDEVYTAIKRSFIKNIDKPLEKLNKLFKDNIPVKDREFKVTYEVFDAEIDLFKSCMSVVHEWGPDWLAVWNIDFDFTCMLQLCEKFNVDIADIISDPSIPKEYRFCTYKKAQEAAVSASGTRKNTDPQAKWNIVFAPAKFHWVDAMSAYHFKRSGSKKVAGGYGLDNILNTVLGKEYKKLKFPHLTDVKLFGADYHRYMTKNHPLEYIIYNQWDVLSMIELDNVTKDLQVSVPVFSGISPFEIFNSGPKKLVNSIFFEYLDAGYVLGTKSPYDALVAPPPDLEGEEEEDELDLRNWIITLPNKYLREGNASPMLLEDMAKFINVRMFVYDCDQSSGYPSDTIEANVSGITTKCEIMSIGDIDNEVFKKENINLMFGVGNHMQYCQTMMNFPTLEELDIVVSRLIKEDEEKNS